ncbi:MAG: ShlB/FhaC/HecB family hemolysin secretion/activation protein [Magnetococcales bacterium]|nr:ShlB/FhaC/HecB family hemolysin secretion/activation protein [Magnetococcales bacterium]
MRILLIRFLQLLIVFAFIFHFDMSVAFSQKDPGTAQIRGREPDYLTPREKVCPVSERNFTLPKNVELFGSDGLENLCIKFSHLQITLPSSDWGRSEDTDDDNKINAKVMMDLFREVFGKEGEAACKGNLNAGINKGEVGSQRIDNDLLLFFEDTTMVVTLAQIQDFVLSLTKFYRRDPWREHEIPTNESRQKYIDEYVNKVANIPSSPPGKLPMLVMAGNKVLTILGYPAMRMEHFFLSRAFLPEQELCGFQVAEDSGQCPDPPKPGLCAGRVERCEKENVPGRVRVVLVEGFLHQPKVTVRPNGEKLKCKEWVAWNKNSGNLFKRNSFRFVNEHTCENINKKIKNILAVAMEKKPLTMERMERALLLANDLPGINIEAVLAPVAQDPGSKDAEIPPGASGLEVRWTLDPMDLYVGWDNQGSEFMGPEILTSTLRSHSLLWAGDQWSVQHARALPERRELALYSLEASIPVFPDFLADSVGEGLRFRGKTQFSDSRLGGSLADYEMDTLNQGWEAGIEYPILLQRDKRIDIRLGTASANAHTTLFDQTYSDDRIRTAFFGSRWGWKEKPRVEKKDDAKNILRLEDISLDLVLSKGLDIDHATNRNAQFSSRGEAGSDFYKARMNWRGYWEFGKLVIDDKEKSFFFSDPFKRLTVLTEIESQTSSAPLLSGEEFGVGGRNFGQVYGPGEISGDHGIAGKLELGWKMLYAKSVAALSPDYDVNPTRWDAISTLNEWDVTILGFIEGGKIWNSDKSLKKTMQEQENLASIGAGLRFRLRPENELGMMIESLPSGYNILPIIPIEQLIIDASYGWPLGQEPATHEGEMDPQLKINIAVQF